MEKKSKFCGVGVGEEDDDCVVLDSDPDGPVAVGEEKGSAGFDGRLDELQIVAEKGQVFAPSVLDLRMCACRTSSTLLHWRLSVYLKCAVLSVCVTILCRFHLAYVIV